MLKDSRDVTYFILFESVLFSILGGAYHKGVVFFLLSSIIFALLFAVVFIAYIVVRKGVYYVADLLKSVNIALEKEEKKETKQIRK